MMTDEIKKSFFVSGKRWYAKNTRNEAKKIRNIVITKRSKCAICKNSDYNSLELHHITPVSIYGDNELTNLICLCKRCHVLIHRVYSEGGDVSSIIKMLDKIGSVEKDIDVILNCVNKYKENKRIYEEMKSDGYYA